MSIKVRIDDQHQIVIPTEMTEALRLHPGDQLLAQVEDGVIILVPQRGNAIEQLKGLHREIWAEQDAQEYVNAERDAWETS